MISEIVFAQIIFFYRIWAKNCGYALPGVPGILSIPSMPGVPSVPGVPDI